MNQIANYSQTDWTLWYSGLSDNRVLCKSGAITSMQRVTDTNNFQQINLQYNPTDSMRATVYIDQNIYIFDADKISTDVYAIPGSIPQDGVYGVNKPIPYVIMDGKFIQVTAKKNMSEAIIYPYGYAGVIDTSATYELTDHAFGEGLKGYIEPEKVADPVKSTDTKSLTGDPLTADPVKKTPVVLWIFLAIFILVILFGITAIIFVYRNDIKAKFSR